MLTVNKNSKTAQQISNKRCLDTPDVKLYTQTRSSQNKTLAINSQVLKNSINKQINTNNKSNLFKRINNRLQKQDSRSKQTRQRSSSSFCEAGCLRRSVAQNSKNKKEKTKHNKNIEYSQRQKKIHNAIQKFYTNLSTMPLDVLITHTNPQKWLQEQHQTCDQLKTKLKKQHVNNKQSANSKQKQQIHEYYCVKLDTVQGILINIQNNMKMLAEIYQNQLRRYQSNSSLASSVPQSAKKLYIITQNSSIENDSAKIDNRNKYQSKLLPNLKVEREQISTYQIQSHHHNDQSQSMIQKQYKQKLTNKPQNNLWNKFNNNLKKLLSSQQKTQHLNTKKQNSHQFIQKNTNNYAKQYQNLAHLISTSRSEDSPQNSYAKTKKYLSSQLVNNTDLTKQKHNNSHVTYSISELMAKSMINGNGSKKLQQLKNIQSMLEQFNSIKNQKSKVQYHDVPTEEDNNSSDLLSLKQLKPLLIQISSLKKTLSQKNRQIQNLLRNQQQFQAIIEMFKVKKQQHEQSQSYSLQRINNLSILVQKHEKQIKQLTNANSELRQSIKTQTNISFSLQKQKQKLAQKLKQCQQNNDYLKRNIQNMQAAYDRQICDFQKKQSVAIQKMQIYKKKYYQLLHEGQLKKMIMNNTYEGKAGKVKQIWSIIADHRRNLQSLDKDKQNMDNNCQATKRHNKKNRLFNQESEMFSSSNNVSSGRSPHLIKMQHLIHDKSQKMKNPNKMLNFAIENSQQNESQQN